jgi:hypothetical protein
MSSELAELEVWSQPLPASHLDEASAVCEWVRQEVIAAEVWDEDAVAVQMQGSIRQGTTVGGAADFDVDVAVVNLGEVFSAPPLIEQAQFETSYIEHYEAVEWVFVPCQPGTFSLQVQHDGRKVDIVPSLVCDNGSARGIVMSPGRSYIAPVFNWPEMQLRRNDEKDARTGGHYRPMVRIAKGLAAKRYERRGTKRAPSFLVESLVQSAPDELFTAMDLRERAVAVLDWMRKTTREDEHAFIRLMDAGGMSALGAPWQVWDRALAREYAVELWDELTTDEW